MRHESMDVAQSAAQEALYYANVINLLSQLEVKKGTRSLSYINSVPEQHF